jgi:hypothetical protein
MRRGSGREKGRKTLLMRVGRGGGRFVRVVAAGGGEEAHLPPQQVHHHRQRHLREHQRPQIHLLLDDLAARAVCVCVWEGG